MLPTRDPFGGSNQPRSLSAIDRLVAASCGTYDAARRSWRGDATPHQQDVSPRALILAAVCLLAGATLAYAGRAGLALPFFLAASCLAGFTILRLMQSTRRDPAAVDLVPMLQGMATLGPLLRRGEYRDVILRFVRGRWAGKEGTS